MHRTRTSVLQSTGKVRRASIRVRGPFKFKCSGDERVKDDLFSGDSVKIGKSCHLKNWLVSVFFAGFLEHLQSVAVGEGSWWGEGGDGRRREATCCRGTTTPTNSGSAHSRIQSLLTGEVPWPRRCVCVCELMWSVVMQKRASSRLTRLERITDSPSRVWRSVLCVCVCVRNATVIIHSLDYIGGGF